MILQNVTMVILRCTPQGLKVVRVCVNPQVAEKDGKPVIGHLARRLLSVKEIAQRDELSLNKAAEKRRDEPLLCLADFEGQESLNGLPRLAV